MTLLRRLARRFAALTNRDTLNREVDAEMRLHLELEADELARVGGLDPHEARRQAALAFGGVDRFAEAHHDARGVRWIEDFGQDVKYAARALRRSPAFTLTTTLVLALGIGASTAIFSAVDAVLVSRLPYPDDDRLVRIYQQNSPTNRFGVSVVDYNAIVAQQRSFSAVGAMRRRDAALAVGAEVRRASVASVDPGFFAVLGTRPSRGRLFDARDAAPDQFSVVVSHDFAVREFGGDGSAALGKTITIDDIAHAIIGVLGPTVRDLAGVRADVWATLKLQTPERRGPFGMGLIARLRDGATVESATRDLAGVSERIFPAWASSFQDRSARLTPYSLRTALLGNASQTLGIFGVAVALVLLIAIANVASLTLVRVTSRSRESVLRTLLGASSSRVARLLVTESLLLAALGAAAGAMLAPIMLQALATVGPRIPRLSEASVDLRSVAFAAMLAVVTGVLVGLYPALSLLRGDLSAGVRSGDREVGASRAMHALRGGLVAGQFALALPVLATAALLLNSFVRLQRVDAGFDPQSLVYVNVALPVARYDAPEKAAAFWNRALARLADESGVVAAGIGDAVPPDQPSDINNFDLVDRPVPPGGAQPTAPYLAVNTAYFGALGLRLLDGRLFTEADTGSAPPVMVVSQSWARRYSSDRPVVGRQLQGGGCTTCPPFTIVGVVGDVKYQGLEGNGDAMYVPAGQNLSPTFNLFVRTAPGVVDAVDRVRDAIRAVDPALALDDAGSLEDRVYASVAPQRHWATLLGGFAGAALSLAAIGIFGMLSCLVAARRREIGVRVALGATPGSVVAMIVGRGMAYAVPGALVGLAVSIAVRRRLESVLFDVGGADPTTLTVAMVVFLAVALVASLLAARRAAHVSPLEAMRDA